MDEKRLWAKSAKRGEPAHSSMLLKEHLQAVYLAAKVILDQTGDAQLQALGLDLDHYRKRFTSAVLLAAALHDLGKANDHFQGMIRGTRDILQNPQGLRHEWISLILLQECRDWYAAALTNKDDIHIVEWAIGGHHPSCKHPSPPKELVSGGSGTSIKLLNQHEDFRQILCWLKETFQLSEPPRYTSEELLLIGSDSVFEQLRKWSTLARKKWDTLPDPERKLVAAVKSCVLAADVAGSILSGCEDESSQHRATLTDLFRSLPDENDIQKVVERRLQGQDLRSFQTLVASSETSVTYVKAGCGSGKTLAAYLWAARRYPKRRLYFCYPTTGTATEGFKDYLFEPDSGSESIGVRLFHSRSVIDTEMILKASHDLDQDDPALRNEALDLWGTPIVVCTVDTILGIMQNHRRGLYLWPALAQGVFIFDEIHAYDNAMFGTLLRFLRELSRMPVLLMTASLPEQRETELKSIIQKYRHEDLQAISGPVELERLPRYYQRQVTEDALLPTIKNELSNGGKILCVCNTVSRAMEFATQCNDIVPDHLIYHSRFRYEDRVDRHREMVQAFSASAAGPQLAICTQVAEMSLDLQGCTMLISDLAPIPALIQRLGRLNRQAGPGSSTCPFIIRQPDKALPYQGEDLEEAQSWLNALPATDLSQHDLVNYWKSPATAAPSKLASAWFDGGPSTLPGEFREGSPSLAIILEKDCKKIKSRHDLKRYLIPMTLPNKLEWRTWHRVRGVPVPPSHTIDYCSKRGAAWLV